MPPYPPRRLASVLALSNALSLGDKILSLLTSTASSSPGIANDKGNLLQTAISIFGAQTGFSPVFQDIMVLAKIADKVFKQIQAASGRNTPAESAARWPPASGSSSCGNRCDYHHHGDRPEQWSGERESSGGCGSGSRGCGSGFPRLRVPLSPAAGTEAVRFEIH